MTTCEHCDAPATTRPQNLRGLLARRCARCAAEQARLQAEEIAAVVWPKHAAAAPVQLALFEEATYV